ncbi:MAG: DUF983 domain-containing protein [Gemmatimonadales bacterium]|nr:DUF983 domain-containing protein [Gemmatimonadales bacterium]
MSAPLARPEEERGLAENVRLAAQLVARSVTRRCPHCGAAGIFVSYWRLRRSCPACRLHFERSEEGYRVGTYMFNLIGSEFLFVALAGLVAWRTWPDPPWRLLQYGGGALMVVLPVVLYPLAQLLFCSMDLFWNPPGPDDGRFAPARRPGAFP